MNEIYTSEDIQNLDFSKYSKVYYRNQVGVRKSGIIYNFTEQEKEEYIRCSKDIVYFAENYCKIPDVSDGNFQNISLRDYQKELLQSFHEERFNTVIASSKVGITIVEVVSILHTLVFSTGKNILLVEAKKVIGVEKFSKVVEMYKGLPFFLKPGILSLAKDRLKTETRNTLIVRSAKNFFIGSQVHYLNIGSAGIISNSDGEQIMKAVFPVMNAIEDTKIIIGNTGHSYYNWSYEIFRDAESGKNKFKPHKISIIGKF